MWDMHSSRSYAPAPGAMCDPYTDCVPVIASEFVSISVFLFPRSDRERLDPESFIIVPALCSCLLARLPNRSNPVRRPHRLQQQLAGFGGGNPGARGR
jgi:hypothetical protein